jgi:hypothetical protein
MEGRVLVKLRGWRWHTDMRSLRERGGLVLLKESRGLNGE